MCPIISLDPDPNIRRQVLTFCQCEAHLPTSRYWGAKALSVVRFLL